MSNTQTAFSLKQLQAQAEVLFATACSHRGYRANKITECNDSKTPDFLVEATTTNFIAEIKSPGIEPQVKEYTGGNEKTFVTKSGKLVRSLIKSCSQQLELNPNKLPAALVICDLRHHVPKYPLPPWFYHFGPDHISAGMFGETVYGFAHDKKLDAWKPTRPSLGGNQTLRPSVKEHISAVALLICNDLNSNGIFLVYHNPFTTRPLPTDIFSSQNDRHFRLRVEGDVLFDEWKQTV